MNSPTPTSYPPSVFVTLYGGIFLLATNGLFAKGIPLDAVSITQIRSVISLITLSIVLLALKRTLRIQPIKKQVGVLFLGVLMGLHWITFFHSMQISTIAIGMLSLYSFPMMVVMIEAAIHKHWPRWQDCLSALALLSGIFLLAGDETFQENSETWQGILWGIVSALLFASRNLLQKYCFADVSSDRLMLHQMIAIAAMLLVFIDFSEIQSLTSLSWVKLMGLGILTTALAHTLLVKSYKNLPAKTVAMISCIQPVIGATLAWLVLGETINLYVLAGGGIILAVAVYENISLGSL